MPFGRATAAARDRPRRPPKPPLFLTPATDDPALAQDWFDRFEGAGLDGVVAKRTDEPYKPGARAMLKIKHLRTVDCVVGGFRWNRGEEGKSVGSLLLGLYDDNGVFHHVGHTSSFKAQEKRELVEFLAPYRGEDEDDDGFGKGRTPGAPSRWTGDRDMTWVRLRPGAGLRGDVRLPAGPTRPGAASATPPRSSAGATTSPRPSAASTRSRPRRRTS